MVNVVLFVSRTIKDKMLLFLKSRSDLIIFLLPHFLAFFIVNCTIFLNTDKIPYKIFNYSNFISNHASSCFKHSVLLNVITTKIDFKRGFILSRIRTGTVRLREKSLGSKLWIASLKPGVKRHR